MKFFNALSLLIFLSSYSIHAMEQEASIPNTDNNLDALISFVNGIMHGTLTADNQKSLIAFPHYKQDEQKSCTLPYSEAKRVLTELDLLNQAMVDEVAVNNYLNITTLFPTLKSLYQSAETRSIINHIPKDAQYSLDFINYKFNAEKESTLFSLSAQLSKFFEASDKKNKDERNNVELNRQVFKKALLNECGMVIEKLQKDINPIQEPFEKIFYPHKLEEIATLAFLLAQETSVDKDGHKESIPCSIQ